MNRPFRGLSAFPLTPSTDSGIDHEAYSRLVGRLAEAGVDSIGALGSTGSAAYLSREERATAARIAVESAGGVPVVVGIGALRTRDVLRHMEDAQLAGASALLLPAMTYQPLGDDEVLGLYADVSAEAALPLIVYDNPGTTRVDFSDELHARIAELPGVVSVKIPPVLDGVRDRLAGLRAVLPAGVGIGMSGDSAAAGGLLAGCDTWYSVLGGVLPEQCLEITRAALDGREDEALEASARLSPLWDLFAGAGSYRVVTALAEVLDLIPHGSLPRPVRGVDAATRARIVDVVDALGLR